MRLAFIIIMQIIENTGFSRGGYYPPEKTIMSENEIVGNAAHGVPNR